MVWWYCAFAHLRGNNVFVVNSYRVPLEKDFKVSYMGMERVLSWVIFFVV